MANVRENSQQDRRVYVGNLSYDVKWHHLKDFMRQGQWCSSPVTRFLRRMAWDDRADDVVEQRARCSTLTCYCFRME